MVHPGRAKKSPRVANTDREETRVATASPEAGTLQAAPPVSLTGTANQAGAFLLHPSLPYCFDSLEEARHANSIPRLASPACTMSCSDPSKFSRARVTGPSQESLPADIVRFLVWTTLGNALGGTVFVAILKYGLARPKAQTDAAGG